MAIKQFLKADLLDIRQGTAEEKAIVNIIKDQAVELSVLYTNSLPPPDPNEDITKRNSQPALMRGLVNIYIFFSALSNDRG